MALGSTWYVLTAADLPMAGRAGELIELEPQLLELMSMPTGSGGSRKPASV